MHPRRPPPMRSLVALAAVAAATLSLDPGSGLAQSGVPTGPTATARQEGGGPPLHSLGSDPADQRGVTSYAGGTKALINTPVSGLFPGGVSTRPDIKNPVGSDPAAPQRGMAYFSAFNCVGCHAANGGGGMGRALSNRYFQYGAEPANIYLSIVQGRPNGMPAWGGLLPDSVIWDLVAYIQQISQAPVTQWGTTISRQSPAIEQAPAEYLTTTTPWAYTEPFSYGQKPQGRNDRK